MKSKFFLVILAFAASANSQTITVVSGNGQLVPAGVGQGSQPVVFSVVNGTTPVADAQIKIINVDQGSLPLSSVNPTTDANGHASTVFVLGQAIAEDFLTFHFRASISGGSSVDFYETAVNASDINLSGPSGSVVSPYTATAGQAGAAISATVFAGGPVPGVEMRLAPASKSGATPPAGTEAQSIGCSVNGQTVSYVLTGSTGTASCNAVFAEPNAAVSSQFDSHSFYVIIGEAYRYGPFPYNIAPQPPTINPPSSQVFLTNSAIAETISVTGGLQPFTFALASGSSLPSGVSLNTTTGTVTGMVSKAGIYPFVLQVTDSLGRSATSGPINLIVSGGVLAFAPSTLPTAIVKQSYSQAITLQGGVPPYKLSAQTLPPGITGTTTDSVGDTFALSGSPSSAGTFTFTLSALDSNNSTISKMYTLTVVSPLTLSAPTLPIGVVGASYSATVAASGGLAPFTYSSSTLPAGLSISSTGVITGTPTAIPGLYTVTINVSDSGGETASGTAMLALSGGQISYAAPVTLPAGTAGQPYSASLPAPMGGVPPYSYALSGTPPTGINLSTSGTLSGTFNVSGTQTISFTVTDAVQETAMGSLTLTLSPSAMSVVSAASFGTGPVSPGELVTIFGAGIGPSTASSFTLSSTGTVPTTLANVQVSFGSLPAPILYVSNTQVNAIVPFGVTPGTTVPVTLTYGDLTPAQINVTTIDAAPGIFLIGKTQGAILNSDYSVNGASNPAIEGKFIQIYATGASTFTPALTDGEVPTIPSTQNVPDVNVYIGGQVAQVLYAGTAPGLVAGVLIINAIVPTGIPAGNDVLIAVTIGADSSISETSTLAVTP